MKDEDSIDVDWELLATKLNKTIERIEKSQYVPHQLLDLEVTI